MFFGTTKYKRISVEEARALMEAGEAAVFDMRDEASYSQAHIEGAKRISDANLGDVLTSLPKDRSVLIYCYRGKGSRTYAQTFVDFGFSDVYSMDGGFNAWRASGPEVQAAG